MCCILSIDPMPNSTGMDLHNTAVYQEFHQLIPFAPIHRKKIENASRLKVHYVLFLFLI